MQIKNTRETTTHSRRTTLQICTNVRAGRDALGDLYDYLQKRRDSRPW